MTEAIERHLTLAREAAAEGRAGEARNSYARAAALSRESGAPLLQAHALRHLSELDRDADHLEQALAHADRIAILQAGRLLQCASAEEVYRRPASLSAARALGSVNVLAHESLPAGWRETFNPGGLPIGFRPEGVLIDPGSPVVLTVIQRRLAGPLVRLTLEGGGLKLTALVPHSLAPAPGAQTGVHLDPALTFTVTSGEI
jgi:hypothetical protein